ncbi:dehydrodolichyl diphosphate synthase complex subunit nus1 [Thrips palmi]|uniref:ditrans,polycis-polyprenyl diphosphate synthase [(2E,6E)-farnesyldiphosphate specific] n=1 Tax=Thrips palmi TaxID=161013 RepID=A0A6P9A8L1_THRPL|nr:dehydrodolichyl diphosphate synthase complex subunit nus1 [Thrips palmi]
MAVNLFKVVLVVIHVIFDIYAEARRLFRYAIQYFEDFCFGPWGLKAELDYVHRNKAPLTKPMSHIAVILGSEVVSIKDIVRIALWSHAAGASYVSFYDHSGKLKKCKSALDEALTSECQPKSHIPRTNGYKNGIAGKQYPHVMLFDITDGKAGIARIARELCEKALAKEITHNDINLKFLNEIVLREAGVPEPELGIYCGDICSTYGFLPWHSRITEFLPISSHHNVSVRTFVSVLRRFNKCEQRLGT